MLTTLRTASVRPPAMPKQAALASVASVQLAAFGRVTLFRQTFSLAAVRVVVIGKLVGVAGMAVVVRGQGIAV